MPKNNKKSKQQQAAAVTAQATDDFDDMLAELRAADLTTAATSTSTGTNTSSTSSTPTAGAPRALGGAITNATRTEAPGEEVPEATLLVATSRDSGGGHDAVSESALLSYAGPVCGVRSLLCGAWCRISVLTSMKQHLMASRPLLSRP